jgi:molecular chaperone GrpE
MTDTDQTLHETTAPLETPAVDDGVLTTLRTECDNWRDKALRAAAELENFRKRSQQEVAEARLYAAQSFAKDVLSVVDNLQRALQSPATDGEALRKGVELTASQFATILARHGIVPTVVQPGMPLNPELHQVMMETPSSEVPPGHVVAELQAGFTLHGRLLRAALVSVSNGEAA